MKFLIVRPHERHRRRIGAYVEGALAPAERTRFTAHLAACETCARAVDETRTLVSALRQLAPREAPRSFRLTPAMVSKAAPVARRPLIARPAFVNGARAVAGLAAAALAVAVVLDVAPGAGGENDGARDLRVPASEAQDASSQSKAVPSVEAFAVASASASSNLTAPTANAGGVSGAAAPGATAAATALAPAVRNGGGAPSASVEALSGTNVSPAVDAAEGRDEHGDTSGWPAIRYLQVVLGGLTAVTLAIALFAAKKRSSIL